MDNVDLVTKFLNRALDILLLRYPARTGFGVIIGALLFFLTTLFEPLLARNNTVIDFANAPSWGWFTIGIMIMHIPTIISLFKQQSVGDAEIDQALQLVELGNFTPQERRQHYRNLIDRAAGNFPVPKDVEIAVLKLANNVNRMAEAISAPKKSLDSSETTKQKK